MVILTRLSLMEARDKLELKRLILEGMENGTPLEIEIIPKDHSSPIPAKIISINVENEVLTVEY